MGQEPSGRWAGLVVVCFEPAGLEAPQQPDPALEAAFAALAGRGRLVLLATLAGRGEMYAQELVAATGLPQATVATHLSELLAAGLVAAERRGHRRYYAAVPDRRLAAEVLRLFGG